MIQQGAIGHASPWQKLVAVIALVLLPLGQANATTVTSATLDGSVTDQNGAAVEGATVRVVHVPTGQTKTLTTNASGNFFQSGLRVGGPFTITVDADGFRGSETEEIFLRAGDNADLRLRLRRDGIVTEEVVVVGQRVITRDLNNGAGSAYTAEDITNQPSTQRDVIRTLLRDPLAQSDGEGNLSVAGVNPRFNALAIDGALQTDDFGLSTSTYGTTRSPINLDAVESASLVATDYSVMVSGFTGGLVTLTTKSGTNEFDGSVFYYYQDEDYIGDDFDGGEFVSGPFEEEEYGFTLGGPILRDRLFFFVSYDEYENVVPADFSAGDSQRGIQPGFFSALNDEILAATGFDAGGRPGATTTPDTTDRTLVKLDANITEDHRASFTYQNNEDSVVEVSGTSFSSAWYGAPQELTAYTYQLFSDWTPQLSTTLRVNYKEFERAQNCQAGRGVGAIVVEDLDPDDLIGTPLEGLLGEETTFVAGCDTFRHANTFEDERLQVFATADYQWEDHVTTAGVEYEDYDLDNLFAPGTLGEFVFDGLPGLRSGVAEVEYTNAPSNDQNDLRADWGYEKWSLFAQDVWQLTPQLEVNFGLRYERYEQSDAPARNPTVLARYGVDTSSNLDGIDLLQPRVGFRWDALPSTTLSGGFGLFSGGDPKVWTSNAFTPGQVTASADVANVDISTIPAVLQDQVALGNPLAIDAIADDFDIPSDWKASLRADTVFDARIGDFSLGEDYSLTLQYVYTQVNKGFLWTNIAQTQNPGALPTGVAPDGRPIYADLFALGNAATDPTEFENLTLLNNFDEGESHVLSIALQKQFDNGFDFQVSYAYQDTELVTEGTSSRGISNVRGTAAFDKFDPQPNTAPFEVQHAFKFNLGFEREFIPGARTRVDFFGRLFQSDPFFYSFNVGSRNSLFGRAFGSRNSPFDNDQVYIPVGPNDPLVVYAGGFDQDAFFDYVAQKGIASGVNDIRGENGPWNNIWDFQLQQELPSIRGLERFVGENNIKLVFIVDNFLNLLNDDWGKFTTGASFGQAPIVTADLVSAADVAANGVDGATALTGDLPRTTCQQASDCVYRFESFRNRDNTNTVASQSIYRIRLGIRMDF